MYPTGGFTTLLSPDDCQTAIDTIMFETFDRPVQPAYVSVVDPMFFHQSPIDTIAFIWDEDSNVGIFEQTNEQQELPTTNTFIGNMSTKRVLKYTKTIPISWEAFKTDQHGKRDRIGVQVGDRAKVTQDLKGIVNSYGDAFDGNVSTTPDGQALCSNTHKTLKGATVDNQETGAMGPDNLWTLVTSLANQPGQDGDPGSYLFEGIMVPFTLYKSTKEVLNSVLAANSGENNLNIFDTDYGQVMIKASIYLGSTYNAGSNANTGYHIVSRNHMMQRKVLSDLSTDIIEPKYSATDSWQHRARFAEVTFPGSWSGYAGSTGTT